jgi:predicted permease
LAFVGAILGLGVAFLLLKLIIAVAPDGVPRLETASIDIRVLAFTLALALASCFIFGLFPALRAARPQLQSTLREGGRGTVGGRDRLRGVLVAAEVSLAIALLVGSGLLIRSAIKTQRVDPGFDPRGVLSARLILPAARYPDGVAISRAYERIRDEAARIPGVQSAAVASVVPLSGSTMSASFGAEEQDASDHPPQANLRLVSGGYFATMGIRMLAGRDLTSRDDAGAPLVVVVNEALVRKLWPNVNARNAVGRRINAMGSSRTSKHLMEIVGVVANLHDAGLDSVPIPEFYAPMQQTPESLWPLLQRSLVVVVRAANHAIDAATLEKPLARAISTVDSSLPIAQAISMTSLLKGSLQTARVSTFLLSTLGGIALLLAMVGIYGVVSYFVNQRTHEIGVRMALGATPQRVWQLIVRRGFTPIAVGLVIGFALSFATTKVLEGHLFGVTTHDPLTLGAVAGLLVLVGLAATYVPARRAMRVPPIVALNEG